MFGYKTLRSLLMAAVVMVAIPTAANAQAYTSKIWSFDVGGGYAIPLGGLSDIAKGGPMIEVGLGYAVSELVGLRVGTEVDLLKGQDGLVATPLSSFDGNITIWHLNGGIDLFFWVFPEFFWLSRPCLFFKICAISAYYN